MIWKRFFGIYVKLLTGLQMTRVEALTDYQLSSALYVARCIDAAGVSIESANLAYRLALTGGTRSIEQLKSAEALLILGGLLIPNDEYVRPTETLKIFCALDDDEALLALRSLFGYGVYSVEDSESESLEEARPAEYRARLGKAGENHVVLLCREELNNLGYPNLAAGVQQVSLVSDFLGYDVIAPAIAGNSRLLEVKTQGGRIFHTVRFFLTRNEYEVGRRRPNWAIVVCSALNGADGAIQVVGWCRASSLAPYLPGDGNGRWTEALVRFPRSLLNPNLPEAV
jgi:hypothetical protein